MTKKTLLLGAGLLGGVVAAKFLYSFTAPRNAVFGLGERLANRTGDDPIIDEESELDFEFGQGIITERAAL